MTILNTKVTSFGLLGISSHDLVLDGISDILLSLGEGGASLQLGEGFDGVEEVGVSHFKGNS